MRGRHRTLTARVRYRYTSQQGRAGPIYGHDDTYEGLGIFFDTFEDAENGTAEPFVVAMMNYGKPTRVSDATRTQQRAPLTLRPTSCIQASRSARATRPTTTTTRWACASRRTATCRT